MKRTIKFLSCILIMVSCFSLLCSCGKSAESLLIGGRWFFENDRDDGFDFFKDGTFKLYLDDEYFRSGKYTVKENEILLLYKEYADEDCIDWDNIDWDNIDREYFLIMNYTFNNGALSIDGYRFKSYSDIDEEKEEDRISQEIFENLWEKQKSKY